MGRLFATPAYLIRIPVPGKTVVTYAEPCRRTGRMSRGESAGRLVGYAERAEPGDGGLLHGSRLGGSSGQGW